MKDKIRTDKVLKNRPSIPNKIMVVIIYLNKELLTRTFPQWNIVQDPLSSNFLSAFIIDSCCNLFLPKPHIKMVKLEFFVVHFLYIFRELDCMIFKISSREALAVY